MKRASLLGLPDTFMNNISFSKFFLKTMQKKKIVFAKSCLYTVL